MHILRLYTTTVLSFISIGPTVEGSCAYDTFGQTV